MSDIICNNSCSDRVFCYNSGIKGKYYDDKRIMFVLHRSDSRAIKKDLGIEGLFRVEDMQLENSYDEALRRSDTGRFLRWLTGYCGMTLDDVYITNMFKCLIPDDREPRYSEYGSCAELLRRQILDVKPEKILVFGMKPYEYMFPEIYKTQNFNRLKFERYENIPALIINHPRRLHGMKRIERQKYLIEIRNFLKS